MNNNLIKVAVVDDHVLLRSALSNLIDTFENCHVVFQSNNGSELTEKLTAGILPDLILLDLNMPVMDGYATALWIKEHFPELNILMLTMYDSEFTLIRLLQAGVKGFLRKDIEPQELKFAITSVIQSGYYYSSQTAGKLANLFRNSAKDLHELQNIMLDEIEIEFLKFACSDLTYKEIALKMNLSPRNVDALRDQLFIKLNVKSRVGLSMVAIRNGIVSLSI